jgi:predicted alpha/beta hydrolase family esterase
LRECYSAFAPAQNPKCEAPPLAPNAAVAHIYRVRFIRKAETLRTAEADIIMIPGLGDSGPGHWQSRWQAKLPSAHRIVVEDWERPDRARWVGAIQDAVARAQKPVVCIAHGLGAVALAHAAQLLPLGKVRGAVLVTPMSETAITRIAEIERNFTPLPRDPLPFPSLFVASRSDPYSDYETSEDLASAWGSKLTDAGNSGSIDDASGHGPWPEGLMSFASFLKNL